MVQRSNAAPEERRALRVNDAASSYGVSRSLIYKLLRQQKLPDVKIAGRRVLPVAALEALLRREAGA